jgi:hypothetical protein
MRPRTATQTVSVVNWLPVFVSEDACRIVTGSLNYCREHKGLRVNAYVIMPTDLHAFRHNNPCRKGLVLRGEHWRFSSCSARVSRLLLLTGKPFFDLLDRGDKLCLGGCKP